MVAVALAVAGCPRTSTIRSPRPDTMPIATETETGTGIAWLSAVRTIGARPLASASIGRDPRSRDGRETPATEEGEATEMEETVRATTTRNPINPIRPVPTSKNRCSVNFCGRKPTRAKPMRTTTSTANPTASITFGLFSTSTWTIPGFDPCTVHSRATKWDNWKTTGPPRRPRISHKNWNCPWPRPFLLPRRRRRRTKASRPFLS
mmetsp:Transcript_17161/g.47211  ORF Transcript_17161/g.47211 Transcript_17161/m.47211 type:complete len:206 (-) Transcript_17161:4945-5562(-)